MLRIDFRPMISRLWTEDFPIRQKRFVLLTFTSTIDTRLVDETERRGTVMGVLGYLEDWWNGGQGRPKGLFKLKRGAVRLVS
jgi:hypothetical protein